MILQKSYLSQTDPVFGILCPKVYISRSTMNLIYALLFKTQPISKYPFDVVVIIYVVGFYLLLNP